MMKVLEEIHLGVSNEHQEGSLLFKQLIHLNYYWPTMEADARRSQAHYQATHEEFTLKEITLMSHRTAT